VIKGIFYPLYESRIVRDLDFSQTPHHVGVILDGNRRWAMSNPSAQDPKGHRRGADKIIDFLGWCEEAQVKVVTLWMLSTDNFKRTPEELDDLLAVIGESVDELSRTGRWTIKAVGALDLLPDWMQQKLSHLPTHPGTMEVNVAIGYGGRREIVDAVKSYLHKASADGKGIDEAMAELDAEENLAISLHGRPARSRTLNSHIG
jgi:short-chain Z-isoprenyl diphosphate synthase